MRSWCGCEYPDPPERLWAGEHALDQVGVQPHPLPFGLTQRTGLVPDAPGNSRPAHVMNQSRSFDQGDHLGGQVHLLSGRGGELGGSAGVAGEVWAS